VTTTIIRNAEPSKKQAKQAEARKGEVKAPIHNGPKVFGVAMPDRNTLDAKGFLMACRDAGKRSFQTVNEVTGEVTSVVKRDEREVRNDLIKAIHAYCGYDNGRDFGSQDTAARAKASRELSGKPIVLGPSREEQKAAERSMTGYVHGMPNYMASKVAELTARETATAEELIDARKEGNEVEVARLTALLSNVRGELSRLGL